MKNGTIVIFRKWQNDDVIALFPEIPANNSGTFCQSYEHVGQHGAADYAGVVSRTKPASQDEHIKLLQELQMIGYDDLVVRKRFG